MTTVVVRFTITLPNDDIPLAINRVVKAQTVFSKVEAMMKM